MYGFIQYNFICLNSRHINNMVSIVTFSLCFLFYDHSFIKLGYGKSSSPLPPGPLGPPESSHSPVTVSRPHPSGELPQSPRKLMNVKLPVKLHIF